MQGVKNLIDETAVRLELAGDVSEDDVERLVQRIFEKYNRVRDTAEMNKPSMYAHPAETGAGGDGTDDWEGSSVPAVRTLLARCGSTADGNASAKGKGKYVID